MSHPPQTSCLASNSLEHLSSIETPVSTPFPQSLDVALRGALFNGVRNFTSPLTRSQTVLAWEALVTRTNSLYSPSSEMSYLKSIGTVLLFQQLPFC